MYRHNSTVPVSLKGDVLFNILLFLCFFLKKPLPSNNVCSCCLSALKSSQVGPDK
jgi:hypothetical protein